MNRLPDDVVVRELILVRGIGEWTADMFLMFQLGRLDVWPTGDFGVRNGYSKMYDLPEMLTPKGSKPRASRFQPYRSLVAWWCWRAVDTVDRPTELGAISSLGDARPTCLRALSTSRRVEAPVGERGVGVRCRRPRARPAPRSACG